MAKFCVYKPETGLIKYTRSNDEISKQASIRDDLFEESIFIIFEHSALE